MVTIKDVALKSGFSVTTVSKALNDYSDISSSTKQLILNLCEEMGYIPNQSARSLVTQKSYTIGIIFEAVTGVGLEHPLFSKILESFKSIVEVEGYDIMFLSKNMGKQNGSYLQHSRRKQVEAILVLCGEFDNPEMHDLYKSDIPVIVIDFGFAGVKNVTSNNRSGVRQAVKYLVDLGHTKVANIHGGLKSYIGGQRKEFFISALKKYNLEYKDEYIVEGENFSKDDGFKAMNKILLLEDQPTAVFCASDMLAIGAIQAIRQAGKSVPEDYSIIGFDGIDIGQIISPRLTTIKQDTLKIGKISASKILQMIKEKQKVNVGETFTVDTYLINGETTKVFR
ncbi:MAG: LacI family DNA-binding transcriptional regulator [Candidatus Izimaplasma sp.]|nr:LacI family DNA-binding transcriptional regulator [Candidatus Izimaplasma bacterium]